MQQNNKILQIIQVAFSPMLIPTYIYATFIYTTYLRELPTVFSVLILLSILIFTGLLPTAAYRLLSISLEQKGWSKLKKRLSLNLLSILGNSVCIYTITKLSFPAWMIAPLVGITALQLILVVTNTYNKVSSTMTSIGEYIGVIYILGKLRYIVPIEWLIVWILIAGVIGTILLYQKRNTLKEQLYGVTLGVITTIASIYIWIYI